EPVCAWNPISLEPSLNECSQPGAARDDDGVVVAFHDGVRHGGRVRRAGDSRRIGRPSPQPVPRSDPECSSGILKESSYVPAEGTVVAVTLDGAGGALDRTEFSMR